MHGNLHGYCYLCVAAIDAKQDLEAFATACSHGGKKSRSMTPTDMGEVATGTAGTCAARAAAGQHQKVVRRLDQDAAWGTLAPGTSAAANTRSSLRSSKSASVPSSPVSGTKVKGSVLDFASPPKKARVPLFKETASVAGEQLHGTSQASNTCECSMTASLRAAS